MPDHGSHFPAESGGRKPEHQPLTEKLREKLGQDVDPEISLADKEQQGTPASSPLVERLRESGGAHARYRVLGEIARGGMGAILKIWDDDLRRALAMKVVLGRDEHSTDQTPHVDPKTLGRFLEEAQITGQLDHPGIVPVHELGLGADGRVYFTMRLVKGRDLREVFELVHSGDAEWNQTRALGVVLKACEAMSYAHAKGVIHRDLKPANIMVGKFGEVYVMDWGLARVLGREDKHDLRIRSPASSTLSEVRTERRESREETPNSPLVTMDGDIVGTPSYMPLEQARGELEKLGPHSDVYALGAMLYHLIGGEMPYVPRGAKVSQRAILITLLERPPRPLTELAPAAPAELVAICEKAMQRESADRYRDTQELADDLRAFLEGRVVGAYETGAWAEARKWISRNKALAASLAVAMTAVLAGGIAFAVKAREAEAARQDLSIRNIELEKSRSESDQRAREARRNLYASAIAEAQSARRLYEPDSLRRALDSAPEELRGWEWRYLDASSDSCLLRIEGREKSFTFAKLCLDGTRIFTISEDFEACLWDAGSGNALASFKGVDISDSPMVLSPGAERIAVAMGDGSVRVIDATDGRELVRTGELRHNEVLGFSSDASRLITSNYTVDVRTWDATTGQPLTTLDHGGWKKVIDMSSDGQCVLTVEEEDGNPRMWNAATGEESVRFHGQDGVIASAWLSPDGSRALTVSKSGTVRLWDATSGTSIAELGTNGGRGFFATFSPDGRSILGGMPREARLWNARTGELIRAFPPSSRTTGDITATKAVGSFDRMSERFLARSGDKKVIVCDSAHGDEISILEGHGESVTCATFSEDGRMVVTGSDDETARVWDVATGKELSRLEGHHGPVHGVEFSRNGMRILTRAPDRTARVWEAPDARDAFQPASPPTQHWVAFSPDGAQVATAAFDSTIHVWDALRCNQLAILEGHRQRVLAATYSPDGSRIVTSSVDRTARVWDAISGAQVLPLEGHRSWVQFAAYDASGKRIVTASSDKTARVWDAASGAELAKLEGHGGRVSSAAFDPSGERVVTASTDKTARVWRWSDRSELLRLDRHEGAVTFAAFDSTGKRVATASADGTARVWDSGTGRELVRMDGHTGRLTCVSFSPDGTRILTSSIDHTARLWDAATGSELLRLEGHTDDVNCATFSPDGTQILTASTDGTVKTWDTVPYRVRFQQRRALEAALPEAKRAAGDALARAKDVTKAAEILRQDGSLDVLVRRAAIEELIQIAEAARTEAKAQKAPGKAGK